MRGRCRGLFGRGRGWNGRSDRRGSRLLRSGWTGGLSVCCARRRGNGGNAWRWRLCRPAFCITTICFLSFRSSEGRGKASLFRRWRCGRVVMVMVVALQLCKMVVGDGWWSRYCQVTRGGWDGLLFWNSRLAGASRLGRGKQLSHTLSHPYHLSASACASAFYKSAGNILGDRYSSLV